MQKIFEGLEGFAIRFYQGGRQAMRKASRRGLFVGEAEAANRTGEYTSVKRRLAEAPEDVIIDGTKFHKVRDILHYTQGTRFDRHIPFVGFLDLLRPSVDYREVRYEQA